MIVGLDLLLGHTRRRRQTYGALIHHAGVKFVVLEPFSAKVGESPIAVRRATRSFRDLSATNHSAPLLPVLSCTSIPSSKASAMAFLRRDVEGGAGGVGGVGGRELTCSGDGDPAGAECLSPSPGSCPR